MLSAFTSNKKKLNETYFKILLVYPIIKESYFLHFNCSFYLVCVIQSYNDEIINNVNEEQLNLFRDNFTKKITAGQKFEGILIGI